MLRLGLPRLCFGTRTLLRLSSPLAWQRRRSAAARNPWWRAPSLCLLRNRLVPRHGIGVNIPVVCIAAVFLYAGFPSGQELAVPAAAAVAERRDIVALFRVAL